jgi:hypothetical protein
MDTNRIIVDIDTEISKLQQARALLSSVATKKGPARPKSAEATKLNKRRMSAKGRAAISAAMKARWAEVKKAAKKATKTASPAKAVKTAAVG